MDKSNYKSVSHSQTTITELMIPSYANFGGKIHGGILLSLMDKVAYACAAKHSGDYCVTVSVDTVDFLQPVEVGDLVSLLASVNYVGKTSLVIGIKVLAENVTKGNIKHTNTSFFTMVCMGQDGKPREIPGLILENREDVRRYLEAIKRKELKNNYRQELNNQKTRMTVEKELYMLDNERCVIKNL
ncbi:MAG: acyl-CoA thioesterase [Cytophagaceae bacterium]